MLNKKTILIFTEKDKAITATALKQAILEKRKDVVVIIIDSLDLTESTRLDFINNVFKINLNKDKIFAKLQKRQANKNVDEIPKSNMEMRSLLSYRTMEKIYLRYTPEVIVVLGYLGLKEAVAVKNKYIDKCKVVSLIDDYTLNKQLISQGVDKYLVDNIAIKTTLVNNYIEEGKVEVVHLPLLHSFSEFFTKSESNHLLKLDNDKKTILLLVKPDIKMKDIKWQVDALAKYRDKYNLLLFSFKNDYANKIAFEKDIKYFNDLEKLSLLYGAADIVMSTPDMFIIEPAFRQGKLVVIVGTNSILEKKNQQYLEQNSILCDKSDNLQFFLNDYPNTRYEGIKKPTDNKSEVGQIMIGLLKNDNL